MANDLFNQLNSQGGFNPNSFMKELNELKKKGGDPNQMIQELLNSGRITQDQLNLAVNKAQSIMRMLPLGVRR